ncbi:MAG: hypothetical protein ACOZIN_22665 [Myxococcota bacterium]
MNDKQWEAQLKTFFDKAGRELRRMGKDIQVEAERLLDEMKDPARQEKVKEGLREVGTWAKKTAEEVAALVEQGVKKAEHAFRRAATPGAPPKQAAKSTGGKRRKAARPAAAAKKTIGRRRPE